MNLDETSKSFAPDMIEMLARARADLRMGVPVVLNSANPVMIFSIETLSPERLTQISGLNAHAVLVLTAQRAHALKARAYDGDLSRILLPKSVNIAWITALANPADDLRVPMKGPLQCQRDGDASAHRAAIKLIKSARLLPAALVVPITAAPDFAQANALTLLDLAAAHIHLAALSPLHAVIDAALPTTVSDRGRLHLFRPDNGGEEHYAIEIGRPQRGKPVLARLHSACFTGDLLGSLKCDCGAQLRAALAQMGAEGAGVLLYLNQEGRGIGLANKMRAYSLQDQGFDTVEANHRLGFEDDERDFRIGSEILKSLGFMQVRLLTNNPKKIKMMTACGLSVHERVPLKVGENPHNREYMATKAQKSGHLL